MSRTHIAAGNWKMNTTLTDGLQLAKGIVDEAKLAEHVKVIFGVPATHLHAVAQVVASKDHIHVAAQNSHQEENGAYTGEISCAMIKAIGAEYVILGHSERRQYFGENEALLAAKVQTALKHDLQIIFCCGEPLEVREEGNHEEYVNNQLRASLFNLTAFDWQKIIIAYEPIWAIGTGKTASPEQAQDMHANIRQAIARQYSNQLADQCSILYGGSVKPGNAQEIFAQTDVDGGLVGGASLKVDAFTQIIESF